MFDKHRRRRVLYNDDADQQYVGYEGYGYDIRTEEDFIKTRTAPTFDTHVDTYVWCVGNGADPPWGGRERVRPCLGSSGRATDLIVEACHERGMEVWGSLRMNDIHDSFMADALENASDPMKAEHPEWLIAPEESRRLPAELTERFLWTAFNFARPEVGQHRLDFVARNASAHDFDGYELDFTRFVWMFPLGEERKNAHLMTDFVRHVRSALDAIGEKRGRPYTFAVHVPDSPRTSLELGLDVPTWLAEGLVDVLVVGMGYMPYVLPLAEWLALGERYSVPVYPSVNTNTYGGDWTKLHGRPVYHEALRASSAYYWQEGADGLYIFNLFCQEDRNVAGLSRDYIYAPLKDIGEPDLLAGKDKLYAVQPAGDSGFCHHGSEAAPLPVPLDAHERKLPLEMGPDAASARADVCLRAYATGDGGSAEMHFRLNHRLLEVERNGQWLEASVPGGVLRPGYNELSIWRDAPPEGGQGALVVHRVFASVTYA